ncbi:MAG: putative rane protein [Chloroflexi bacterium]|nr:putative rane protein [Chloroflexota bacterium]
MFSAERIDTLPPAESGSRSVNPNEGEADTEAVGPEAQGPSDEPPEEPVEPFWNRQRATTAVTLAVILLMAAGLRLVGLDWDQGQHLHPDERFITMVETKIQLPSSIDLYFDTARSPLNPYNNDFGSYIYGTLPLFFVRSVADAIQGITQSIAVASDNPIGEFLAHLRQMSSYYEIHLLGRVLSALADLLTICFVFLIGRRLFDTRVGLLAALLAAFTALQIQASHFFTAESTVTLFTAAAFYFALRAAQTGGMRDWAFVGVATGLAVASKITALMFGVVILAAAWAYWYRTRQVDTDERRRRYLVEDLITGLLITGVLVFVVFRVGQPYAFAGPGIFDIGLNPKWVQDLQVWQRFATGEADYPPGHQWAGTTPYVWQFTNMTLWGMGPPFAIVAWVGFMLGIVRLLRAPRTYFLYALPIVWIGLNFLY